MEAVPTPREAEVLRLLAEGLQQKQIAREIGTSEPQVKKHLIHLYIRLGAGNAANAVAIAFRRGLLS